MHKINYSKINVMLYFFGGILFYVSPIILLLQNVTKFLSFILPLMLLLIGGYFYFRITKAFLNMIVNKPMIEFTNEEFIDNLNGVKVRWKDIKLLSFEDGKAPFVIFDLNQNSLFYSQITNPLKLLFYKFEAYYGRSFRTNIRFAEGRNADIYKEIERKYQISKS